MQIPKEIAEIVDVFLSYLTVTKVITISRWEAACEVCVCSILGHVDLQIETGTVNYGQTTVPIHNFSRVFDEHEEKTHRGHMKNRIKTARCDAFVLITALPYYRNHIPKVLSKPAS